MPFRKRPFLLSVLKGAAVAAVVATLAAVWLVRRNLPDDAVPRIPGLAAPVEVAIDSRGVPLVTAASWDDAFRVQGYLTARERLFQLELLRRVSAGELSALVGRVALPLDERHRTYGFARVAKEAERRLPRGQLEALSALASGMNAFVDSHRGRWGLEFTLLGTGPRPFTPADSILVLLLMFEDLTSTWRRELADERLNDAPPSLRVFLIPRATRDDVTLVPDATPLTSSPLPDVHAAPPRADGAGAAAAALDEELRRGLGFGNDDEPILGSNAWAVSGALTKSGLPMFANDPHLGIEMPALWLPMRFRVAGRESEGVTLPGVPGLVIGRNESVAWGFTSLMADAQDLYREEIVDGRVKRAAGAGEERVVEREEVIEVRGGKSETFAVRETSHGPLVTRSLALRWTALDATSFAIPLDVVKARSGEELDRAFDAYRGPPMNVVWAAKDGSIGWRPVGLLPIRRPGTDGNTPYDGRDPANDWRGFVPDAELPRVVNPESGYVVTANQRTIGNSFPHVVATDWGGPSRARRIRDLLEEAKREVRKLDRDAFEAIQMDVLAAPVRALVPAFLPHLPEDLAAAMKAWDGQARVDGPETLVARSLRTKLRERALRAWKVRGWSRYLDDDLWVDLANADDVAWRRAGLGEKGAFLKGCADASLKDLRTRFGTDWRKWKWGDANRLRTTHPLGNIAALSWLFNPPQSPQSGTGDSVKASSPKFGQSMRFLLDWGAPEAATLVLPFGVSGHVFSRNRLDQHRYWLAGDPGGNATRLAGGKIVETLRFQP